MVPDPTPGVGQNGPLWPTTPWSGGNASRPATPSARWGRWPTCSTGPTWSPSPSCGCWATSRASGCWSWAAGPGQSLVCLAKKGAHAIGLDFDAAQLAGAKRLADAEGVRVELHQGDLADLAFMRGDSVDLVLSAYALGFVEDLNRVFRQVHRVLKEGAPLVFSLPHPVYDLIDHHGQALVIRRSYFDHAPLADGFHHTVSDLFAGLSRAKFRVDVMLEPEPSIEGPRAPSGTKPPGGCPGRW